MFCVISFLDEIKWIVRLECGAGAGGVILFNRNFKEPEQVAQYFNLFRLNLHIHKIIQNISISFELEMMICSIMHVLRIEFVSVGCTLVC